MYVLTVDQRGSRRTSDRVDGLLAALGSNPAAYVRGFERTAGDELQGVLDDPPTVVDLVLRLVRDNAWSVGVGVGPVNEPLPESTRAGSGGAFNRARDAVTRAKSRPTGLAVTGGYPAADARRAQTALDLLAAVVARRSDRGWEAVDLAAEGLTQIEVADRLGVSKQAVSQRLQAAGWHLEPDGRALASHLLSLADGRVSGS
ncbi:MAG: hypothetical protein ACRDWY_09720 [Actinomycetes bacterium]